MKRILRNISFGVIIFFSNHSFGQELLPHFYDSTLANHQLIISGNGFTHSSALYNGVGGKFIFGGPIEREWSEKAWERQRAHNRVGGGYYGRIEYRSGTPVFKKNEEWSWMLSASYETHFQGQYTDDLFGLTFIGNEPYFGKDAVIDGSSARFDQFWTIGGGFHNRKTKSFATINVVLPQSFFFTNLSNGTFEFDGSGDALSLKTEGTIDLGNPDLFFKGMGAAINFDFNFPFGDSSKFNGVFSVQARNIGFYRLHENEHYAINIDEQFSGFSLNDLIGENELPSIMDTLGIEAGSKTRYKLMPGYLQIGKIISAQSKYQLQPFFGVRIYATQLHRPMVYVGAHYQPHQNVSLGTQFAFGGYGGFRAGLYLNYNTEKIVVGIGTEDLLGAILKKQYGYSALMRLAWKF